MGSMHDIWQALGIEATGDALAIKRAYALRLRVTRPDDDAQAYQQLRQAYEWALAHARRQQHAALAEEPAAPMPAAGPAVQVEVPRAEVPAAPAAVSEVVAAEAEPQPEPEAAARSAPDWVEPGALAHQLYQHWEENGDEALIQAWPRVHALLDAVPLALRDESARWFAELILRNADLPGEFVLLLARHFEWGRDFRVERVLGAERAEALRERLSQDIIVPVRDPEVLARYADVLTLNQLLEDARRQPHWRPFKGWLFAALAHPASLAQRLESTPPRLLRALGVEPMLQAPIRTVVRQSQWALWALVALGLSFIPMAGEPIEWFVRAFMLAVLPPMAIVLCSAFGDFMSGLQGNAGTSAKPRSWRWFEKHRDSPRLLAGAAAGIALSLALALAVHWVPSLESSFGWWPMPWFAVLAAGSLLSWPRGRAWEPLLVPVAVLAAISILRVQGSDPSFTVAISGAALWLSLCNALLVQRGAEVVALMRRPWHALRPRTWRGWVFLLLGLKFIAAFTVVMVVLALPLFVLVTALSFGWVAAWGGVAAALVLGATGWLNGNLALLLPTAAAAALALGLLQHVAARLSAQAWFRR